MRTALSPEPTPVGGPQSVMASLPQFLRTVQSPRPYAETLRGKQARKRSPGPGPGQQGGRAPLALPLSDGETGMPELWGLFPN